MIEKANLIDLIDILFKKYNTTNNWDKVLISEVKENTIEVELKNKTIDYEIIKELEIKQENKIYRFKNTGMTNMSSKYGAKNFKGYSDNMYCKVFYTLYKIDDLSENNYTYI